VNADWAKLAVVEKDALTVKEAVLAKLALVTEPVIKFVAQLAVPNRDPVIDVIDASDAVKFCLTVKISADEAVNEYEADIAEFALPEIEALINDWFCHFPSTELYTSACPFVTEDINTSLKAAKLVAPPPPPAPPVPPALNRLA
jgi:hypothetical protein